MKKVFVIIFCILSNLVAEEFINTVEEIQIISQQKIDHFKYSINTKELLSIPGLIQINKHEGMSISTDRGHYKKDGKWNILYVRKCKGGIYSHVLYFSGHKKYFGIPVENLKIANSKLYANPSPVFGNLENWNLSKAPNQWMYRTLIHPRVGSVMLWSPSRSPRGRRCISACNPIR